MQGTVDQMLVGLTSFDQPFEHPRPKFVAARAAGQIQVVPALVLVSDGGPSWPNAFSFKRSDCAGCRPCFAPHTPHLYCMCAFGRPQIAHFHVSCSASADLGRAGVRERGALVGDGHGDVS